MKSGRNRFCGFLSKIDEKKKNRRKTTMDILIDIKWLLGIMGFHKHQQPGDKLKDFIHRFAYVAFLLFTNVTFFWYIFDEPETYMEPMFGVVQAFAITAIYLGFVLRCDRILELFDEIQAKVEERM